MNTVTICTYTHIPQSSNTCGIGVFALSSKNMKRLQTERRNVAFLVDSLKKTGSGESISRSQEQGGEPI
jgi:hypothetical protein